MAHVVANLTEEQLNALREQQTIKINKNYIKALKNAIEAIKKLDPKDRLDYAVALSTLVNSVKGSLKGWEVWMDFRSMDLLTKEEMEKVFLPMRKATIIWLKADKEITEAKTKEMETKHKKTAKKLGKKKETKKHYVA